MNPFKKAIQLAKDPNRLIVGLLYKYGRILPDKLLLSCLMRAKCGYWPNWENPKTFCEKLQWLKLNDHNPEYTRMVDKYAVKEYVAGIIGSKYVIPTLGVWDTPEQIEWDKLPDRFVLKTTHGGGNTGVVICKNKDTFDCENAIKKLKKSLKQDIYRDLREWPYKHLHRRIIAEEYIEPVPPKDDLPDYKWYCFGGKPRYCQVIQDRTRNETIDFFDTEWQHQDFYGLIPMTGNSIGKAKVSPTRPTNLETQIHIACELSKDIPFCRIDLYEVDKKCYFGEITLYPASGFGVFMPDQYNEILGRMLELPGEKRGGVIIKCFDNGDIHISQPDLLDYKFFCFGGEPKFCQVISGRKDTMCIDFFDYEWNHQPFHEPKNYPFADKEPQKPISYDTMWDLARKLADGKAFSRIDFYGVGKDVFFGEITFFPTSGLGGFCPSEYDAILGEMIPLDGISAPQSK